MSLAVSSLGQRKDEIIRSRKRKLACLYQLQTAERPLLSAPHDPPFSAGLVHFLEQNDLQQGRYFRESTLPPRPQNASLLQVQANAASPAASRKSSPNPRIRSPLSNAPNSLTEPAQADGLPQSQPVTGVHDEMKTRAQTRQSSAEVNDVSTEPVDVSRKSRGKLSGVIIPPHKQSSPARQRWPSPSPSSSPVPVHQHKGSRPESPPYSPGTESKRAIQSAADDTSSSVPPTDGLNVLTPTGDAPAPLDSDKTLSKDGLPSDTQDGEPPSAGSETQPAEATSSPSSAGGPHSTNASRTEAHSPATSLEDEATSSRHRASATEMEENVSRDSPSANTTAEPAQLKEPMPSGTSTTSIQNPTEQPAVQSQTPTSVDASEPHHKSQHLVRSRPASSTVADVSNKSEVVLNGMGMEIDSPETVISGHRDAALHSKGLSTARNNRIQKPRHQRKDFARHASLILSKPAENQLLNAMRLVRQDQGPKESKSASKKRDYLKNMYLHNALKASFSAPLPNLLHESRKTLSSTDYLASLKEEQDDRILRRVMYLQDSNRWSLRQYRPAPEPTAPLTQLDLMLRDVKWLQTDFREERKLKMSLAKALADACAEWVAAGLEERATLQVTPRKNMANKSRSETAEYETEISGESIQNDAIRLFLDPVDDLEILASATNLEKSLVAKIPMYPGELQLTRPATSATQKRLGEIAMDEAAGARNQLMKASMQKGSALVEAEAPSTEVAPEDTFCALFNPESKQLRAKLNQAWAFKPPSTTLPPQGFYENRNASHWTWEDDHQLRTFAKDFPSNWGLISDRMSNRSLFTSYADRRTPWECYERLLGMEGPPADANVRQYMRVFHWRLEQARNNFQAHQAAIQQHAQQQAQNSGQSAPNIPQKRFPSPIRVDRKSSRRFLAMLDGARKLARKREQSQHRAQNTQQAESAPPQRQSSNRPARTPQEFSRMKYEGECQRMEQLQRMREQERVARQARALQQQGAQQTMLTNGIAQHMRNGANNVNGAAGPMQAQMSHQARAASQQAALQMGATPAMVPTSQPGVNSRPQANMQGGQRFAPQMHSQEQMQRMLQQMQQQRVIQQFQNQQQNLNNHQQQNHVGGGGSPLASNGLPNANMLAAYNANGTVPNVEGSNSPSFQPTVQNGSANPSSNMAQQNMMASGGHGQSQSQSGPQTLSSGHTPQIAMVSHQLAQRNPTWTQEQILQATNEHLQKYMQRQRQNALNAAAGVHGQAQANQMQQQFAGGQQQHNQYQQQANGGPQQNAYQQNGMLASGHQQQARGASPSMQQQQQTSAAQSQYNAQMRQQLYNQQRQNKGVSSPSLGNNASVALNGINVNVNGGGGYPMTPGGTNHAMHRPSSSGTNAGIEGQQSPHQRPGSSSGSMHGQSPRAMAQQQQGMAPTPRPVSAHGQAVSGQG